MRQMLLQLSNLRSPSSGDGKPQWIEAHAAANNARKLSWASLPTGSYEGTGRCELLWSSCKMGDAFSWMSRSCCSMKRPFCRRRRVWTLQLKPTRKKLSLLPPMCHGEMEIVSVKELADGSFHFTFGAPGISGSTSKVDELSSIHGEHLAGKLKNSSRLPTRFRKQSPIPAVAARRRKKQTEGSPSEKVSDAAVPGSSEGALKLISRPKSSFMKRSPILERKDVRSGHLVLEARHSASSTVNHLENASFSKKQLHEGPRKGKRSHLSGLVLQKVKGAESDKERETSGGLPSRIRPLPSSNGAPDSSSEPLGEQAAAQHPRPMSKFSRRSPIAQLGSQTTQKLSSLKGLPGESQRQKVLSNSDPSSQTGVACADEASRNLEEIKDTGKSPDLENLSESLLEFPAHSDLRKCKLPELKSIAKSRGLKGYSRLKKEELLDLLEKTEI